MKKLRTVLTAKTTKTFYSFSYSTKCYWSTLQVKTSWGTQINNRNEPCSGSTHSRQPDKGMCNSIELIQQLGWSPGSLCGGKFKNFTQFSSRKYVEGDEAGEGSKEQSTWEPQQNRPFLSLVIWPWAWYVNSSKLISFSSKIENKIYLKRLLQG